MKKKLQLTFLFAIILYIFSLIGLFIDSYWDFASTGEFAVVFGNKVEANGSPSSRLKARLDSAKELYLTHRVEKLIVSGGIGKEGFDESIVMADYLKKNGVVESDIIIDSNGYNTSLTSLNTKSIVNENACIIAVTQQYHVSRAKLSLRNAGFSCVYGYFPTYHELRDLYSWTREIPAWLKYWVTKA